MKSVYKLLALLFLTSILFSYNIQSIKISGNESIAENAILEVLSIKTGDELTTENVISDINSIYSLGIFKDTVGAETKFISGNNVELIFVVEENPIIKQVFFVGLVSFKPEQLLASMNIKLNSIMNFSDLRKDIEQITNFYHERGYVLMSIKEIAEPQDNNAITFVIKEGLIEDIFIKGLNNTKEFVITREMETKVGSAFNIKILQEDVRTIYNTGFLENINIEAPVAGVNPDKVVAVLNVQEKRSGSLQFGGGIGSTSGFFGFLKLEFINFLGQGYNVSAKGQWGEKQLSYDFKYSNLWFWPERTSLTARVWNTDGLIDEGQGLKALNIGGEVTVGKPINKQISVYSTIRANNVTPTEPSVNSYAVRSIGGGINYDTRDYIFNPSDGDYIAVNANTSLKMLGASVEFLKYRVKYNKYFPLAKNLALGLKGTFDDSFGTIADTERYFSGGSTTIRGYRDGSPIAIGGRRALGSVEIRYNLTDAFQLYLFYDFGKTVKGYADCNFYGDSSWRTGKGIGFKLASPIGPLRFDYAWGDGVPYNEGIDSSQGVVHFNIENTF